MTIDNVFHNGFLACSVCFGDPNSLEMKGVQMGIVTLLLVLFFILGCFLYFMWSISKKVKQMESSS